jgi:uncharacterized protein (TIGR03118 family)
MRILYLTIACGSAIGCTSSSSSESRDYRRTDLITDRDDPDLVNPWGVAVNDDGEIWIANNGTGTATVVGEDGRVSDEYGGDLDVGDEITGVVADPRGFVFASESGALFAWTEVQTFAGNGGGSYTGITSADGLFYAADLSDKRIDVFDARFHPLVRSQVAPPFADATIPPGYGPFNIAAIDGDLYVAYALVGPDGDELTGPGRGFVDVYDTGGALKSHLGLVGALNAPWAIVRAPDGFGQFGGAILVGNFGDGRITAYADDGTELGQLEDANGQIEIDGLWGMAADGDSVYFAAGPGDEQHGLFGRLDPA